MDGLIIKKQWLDKIFNGEKCMELRGSNTKKRGPIALIESGSGMVVGTAELIDSFEIDTAWVFRLLYRAHGYSGPMPYKKTYGWLLNGSHRLLSPVPYTHKQGAIIWVKDVL